MSRHLLLALPVLFFACGPEGPLSPSEVPGQPEFPLPIGPEGAAPEVTLPAPPPGTGTVHQPFSLPPVQTLLPVYELSMPAATLEAFYLDVYTPAKPATFRAGGKDYPVEAELRGASSRTFPKKSWKVDLGPLRFEGKKKLHLIAEYQDSTLMTEKLAYDLLEAMGVSAPRARYVRLLLNGRDEGVFLELEAVDKAFLAHHRFADQDANIYRCGWKDCEMTLAKLPFQGSWAKKTNETQPSDDLTSLLEAINRTPEPELVSVFERRLELESYLRTMAMDAAISNSYVEDSESYFVHDKVTDRWTYVPWDLNNADARFWVGYGLTQKPDATHPLAAFSLTDGWVEKIYARRLGLYPGYLPQFSNLNSRVMLNRTLRLRYLSLVERLLDEVFQPAVIHPWIDRTCDLLDPYVRKDLYLDQAKWQLGRGWMKRFVTEREAFVRGQVERHRAQKLGLVIDAFDPKGGWVELRNRAEAPASTEGLVLTTNLRHTRDRNVPTRTLAPGESVRLTAQSLGLSLTPGGELGLYNGKTVLGFIDALFYGELAPGERYARAETEPRQWEIRP